MRSSVRRVEAHAKVGTCGQHEDERRHAALDGQADADPHDPQEGGAGVHGE